MDSSSRQKNQQGNRGLNWYMKPDRFNWYFLTFHTKAFFMRDHILGHQTSLNKFKKIKIILSIFSDHNGITLEINYKKKLGLPGKMEA